MTQDVFIMRSHLEPFNKLEQHWMDILRKQIIEVIQHNIPFTRIVFISIYGSQNYKLAGSYSDVDSECFIFPSIDDFCFVKAPTSFKLHTEYGDIYVKDIRQMFDELRKCSPNILELLSSKYMWINQEYLYYILPVLMDIDRYAQLSTYKLLKGLEGLFYRYTNPLNCSPKNLANAMRIKEMIERIIKGENFSNVLISNNYEELFQIKTRNPLLTDDEDLYNIAIETHELLINYFNSHEFTFIPRIKEMINESQKDLLMKYIHSV